MDKQDWFEAHLRIVRPEVLDYIAAPDPADDYRERLVALVDLAVSSLPQAERKLITLIYYAGVPMSEAAGLCNLKLRRAYKLRSRAFEHLKAWLAVFARPNPY